MTIVEVKGRNFALVDDHLTSVWEDELEVVGVEVEDAEGSVEGIGIDVFAFLVTLFEVVFWSVDFQVLGVIVKEV